MDIPEWIGSVLAIASAVAALLASYLQLTLSRWRDDKAEETFEDRVERAVGALTDANAIVGQLESEIAVRKAAVERLQEHQKLLELDKEQVQAVANLLQGETRKETRRATRIGVGSNFLFFLAGVLVTLALQ